MNYYFSRLLKLLVLLFLLAMLNLAQADKATLANINQTINQYPENIKLFVNKNFTSSQIYSPNFKNKLETKFFYYYFSPWQKPFLFQSINGAKEEEIADISIYLKSPGWIENKQQNSLENIKKINTNMNLSSLSQHQSEKGIIVHETNLRVLPTDKPIFGNWKEAGEGFPFDNMQEALLKANLPVFILGSSKDGAWKLVSTPDNDLGWVNSLDVAFVDQNFIHRWAQSKHFIIATEDNVALLDPEQRYYLSTRIGELFPLVEINKNHYWIKIVVRDEDGIGRTHIVRISKNAGHLFPLTASPRYIAKMISKMQNTPYGWGELFGYRDCSATTKDLFSIFGFWLPRNSSAQAKEGGKEINLANLTPLEKINVIRQKAIPFYSLLSMPGHIMLYIGEKDGKLWIFHSPWGLHTMNSKTNKEGRAIIGRSVITPLDFGSTFENVKSDYLTKITGLTLLLNS